MVPPERQTETYLDGAFWCSTVMTLLDFDGSVKYVWNPFSLAQLKAKLNSPQPFDVYLECVASKNDGTCVAPTDPIFTKQQISLLSVYQRCLTNYQEQLWDQGTYIIFNSTLQKKFHLDQVQMPNNIEDKFEVAGCLLDQKATGGDNSLCLRDYFLKGTQSVDYFAYSNITTTKTPSSDKVDACLTFSGPSESKDPKIHKAFMSCLEDNADNEGCDIPHMLWSGRSNNKIPVATQHTMNVSDADKLLQLVEGQMDAAQASVMKAIDDMQGWDGTGLKITIFSTECKSMPSVRVLLGPNTHTHSGSAPPVLGLCNDGTHGFGHVDSRSRRCGKGHLGQKWIPQSHLPATVHRTIARESRWKPGRCVSIHVRQLSQALCHQTLPA